MTDTQGTMRKPANTRLDIRDMERRLVDFRLTLDREKRRCQEARVMHKYEKLLRERLDDGQVAGDNGIKLSGVDDESCRRLADFLKDTISLCRESEQYQQFEEVIREVLQAIRRKTVEAAQGAGKSLEPFCLFCGTTMGANHHASCHHGEGHQNGLSFGHHHRHEQEPLPINGNAATAAAAAADFEQLQAVDDGQPQQTQEEPAAIAQSQEATPPPSAAPTPDVLELQQQQQQQQQHRQQPTQSQHDTSLQRLQSQFNQSFTSRNYSPSRAVASQQGANKQPAAAAVAVSQKNGTNGLSVVISQASATPPMSPNIVQSLLIQQHRQSQAARNVAATNSQQVTSAAKSAATAAHQYQPQAPLASTNASHHQNSQNNANVRNNGQQQQQQQQQQGQRPQLETVPEQPAQFVPASEDDDDDDDQDSEPDSIRSAIERLDDIELPPQQQQGAANATNLSVTRLSSTPLSPAEGQRADSQLSSDLIIDEEADMSQERPLSPIKPAGRLKGQVKHLKLKNSHKMIQSSTVLKLHSIKRHAADQHQPASGGNAAAAAADNNPRRTTRLRANGDSPNARVQVTLEPAGPRRAIVIAPQPMASSSPSTIGPVPRIRSQAVASSSQPSPVISRLEELQRRAGKTNRTKTTKRKNSASQAPRNE